MGDCQRFSHPQLLCLQYGADDENRWLYPFFGADFHHGLLGSQALTKLAPE